MNVDDILEFYWDRETPVNIYSIAEKMKVGVRFKPLGSDIIADYNGEIIINSEASRVIQRFAAANMLGHKVLRLPTNKPKICSDFNSACKGIDRLANNFAAQLLVPDLAMKYLVFKKGITDVNQLALELDVSSALIGYRLDQFIPKFS